MVGGLLPNCCGLDNWCVNHVYVLVIELVCRGGPSAQRDKNPSLYVTL